MKARYVLHSNLLRVIWFSGEWNHLIVDERTEMRRGVLLNRFFTPRCEICMMSRPSYRLGFENELGRGGFIIWFIQWLSWFNSGFPLIDENMEKIWRMGGQLTYHNGTHIRLLFGIPLYFQIKLLFTTFQLHNDDSTFRIQDLRFKMTFSIYMLQ